MTTEQKFKQSLDIACKNGWKPYGYFQDLFEKTNRPCLSEIAIIENNIIYFRPVWNISFDEMSVSINDLILETNFFDCLFKDFVSEYTKSNDYDGMNRIHYHYQAPTPINGIAGKLVFNDKASTIFKFQWVLEVEKGTALQWLFNQFNL